jgi:plasmid stabilization system protein ParE
MAMMYKIEYISTFHTDILSVLEFLAEYPKKAARIFAKIDGILGNLGEMPEMHPIYQDMPAFRFVAIEDYLVFCKVNKQNGIIEVHRLIYGRMDIPAHIEEDRSSDCRR